MRYLLFALSIFLCCTACQQAEKHRPPNVILILTDDQGYGDLSLHGNDSIDTPNLDQFAQDGLRLDQFYVSPLCAPTRASLLTGRWHLRTGTYWVTRGTETMRSEELTMAEVFKANGYATGCFGKWHNGAHYPYNPNGQGFEEFVGFCSGHWSNYFNTTLLHNDSSIKTKGYITDVLTDHAIDFIEQNQHQPFFCYIPYNTPHSPYQLEDRYFDKYHEKGLNLKNASVHGMVENIDDNIGRLLARLDQMVLAENTIVLFMTDNGPNGQRFNGGMRGWKSKVHEGGVRVPCFIRWPGKIKAGQVNTSLTDHIDILPTLIGLTGIQKPAGPKMDGMDLSSFLTGGQAPFPERTLFTHVNYGDQIKTYPAGVRTPQYHFVAYSPDKPELYDMMADPGEQNNLAESHSELMEQLHQQYLDWFEMVTAKGNPIPATPIGYDAASRVEVPAHEAILSGGIHYKANPNGWAHDWITDWNSTEGKVFWEAEVVAEGEYMVSVQYSCPPDQIGSTLELRIGETVLAQSITEAFIPNTLPSPDRVPNVRTEAFEQDWGIAKLGTVHLNAGKINLALQATSIANQVVGDIKGLVIQKL